MTLEKLLVEIERLKEINKTGSFDVFFAECESKFQGIKETVEADNELIDDLLEEIRPSLLPLRIENKIVKRQEIKEALK